MKRIYFFLGLFLTAKMSLSQVLTENFSYTAGQPLTANGWTAHSAAGTNAITVTSSGLIYSGHPGSGVGNAVSMTTSGEDVNRSFTGITSGAVYFSFLVNVSAAQATGDYFIGILQTTAIFPIRIYAKSDGASGFYFGVAKGNATPVVYETTSRSFGTTYFVVSNYIYNTGTTTDDVINLWINPALGTSEPAATLANVTGSAVTDATTIIGVYLRQGTAANASTQHVDAILVGTTWESVTPAAAGTPLLSAGTVSGFGNVTVSTQSSSQTFDLSGSNLTGSPGDITVSAPSTDFEVSNDNSTWGPTTTIAYATATLTATPVYVRFTPQSVGLKSGDITIAGGGANTTVAVSGTGVTAAPPAAPVATAATGVSSTGFTANWNAVSGATGYYLDVYTISGSNTTDTVAGWYFPINNSTSLIAGVGNVNNAGIQTVSQFGAGSLTYPSGPSGATGSPNPYSVSTNTWDNGADSKYWQIDVNTTGVSNVKLSSLQGSSGTGPRDFKVQYKIGAAGTWTDIAGGTVTLTTAVIAGNLSTWGAISDLSLPADADNQPLVSIRWLQTSNTSVNNSTVASGGTSRISAIYILGDVGGSTTTYIHQNLSVGNVLSYDVTGISPNTTYYYVVRAENGAGTSSKSNEISVVTPATSVPEISTTVLTSFGNVCINTTAGPNSFTINGTSLTTADIIVGPLSGYEFSTTAGGVYSPSLSLSQAGGTYSQEVFVRFSPNVAQSYDGNIVVDGGGISSPVDVVATGTGIDVSTTVTSAAASAITHLSATVAGNYVAGCETVTAYGIEYSTTSGFISGTQVPSTNQSGGNFTSSLTGLSPSTTYYYKAYAEDGSGTVYGTELSFTTLAPPVTLTATSLTAFGAVCVNTNSNANSFTIDGTNLTTANLVVGPLAGYTFSETAGGTFVATLNIVQAGGTQSKTVYVRFSPAAVQSYNGNIPVSGGGFNGTVNVAASGSGINTLPSVTTGSSSNIFTHYATLSGSVSANGCSNVSAYGIEFSGINGFADGNGTKVSGSNLSGGAFSIALNNLVQGATYYYKAYATNNGGTAYGTQQSFTVTAIPDAFTIFPVPAIRGQELRFSLKNVAQGYYGLLFYNNEGKLVLRHDMNIQANFINQAIILPATLPKGTYSVQLINATNVIVTKSILVL